MEHCLSCGAPLDDNSPVCAYCGVSQPLDLRLLGPWSALEQGEDANCPQCSLPLQSLKLEIRHERPVLHCPQCNGLAFSTAELPTILDEMVPHALAVNRALIEALLKAHPLNAAVHYRPCPVCRVLMNRHSAGERSGVVVDVCTHDDLTWLDDGKLRQLCEWRHAGGVIIEQQASALREAPPALSVADREALDRLEAGQSRTVPAPGSLAERVAALLREDGDADAGP